jgi:hypothetical protein
VLRNPGIDVWDTTLSRTIRIRERFSTRLRFETYNTFNHTNFNGLYTTAKFSGPDQIDPPFFAYSSATNQRRAQFAMRMTW